MKFALVFVAALLLTGSASAQQPALPDSAAPATVLPAGLTVYGFADAYYGYDFTGKAPQRPGFLYAHNRANEFALNNAVLGVRYEEARVRGALALHTGTYVEANYANEPTVLRNIYEAYAGFRPTAKSWLDVGIFTSHIGFESALSKDNWTLTRSLMAENSPYYEAGARFTYEVSPTLTATFLVLNGWQQIRDVNRAKSLGTQLQWKPTAKWLLNSSTYYGNDQTPGNSRRRRFFHDFYLTYTATDKLSVAGVLDIGTQQGENRSNQDVWHAASAFVRYQATPQWAVAGRAEYYSAEHGVQISAGRPAGTDPNTELQGASLNLDYAPSRHLTARVEGRVLRSNTGLFPDSDNLPAKTYGNVTTSIALSF
ncbi:porin [Hymenobacter chitinivorans]|uniref:Putative OmpL-like beta-barrel porin-2 n=1 Tax=Hymenobacter chitinivorans DSM 11115 TaxID=1121954 RepID=A0A2M9BR72_9BACT|nr:porin [Hymenobacter chitinivorans]PJJ60427.1 putative OmpL-like beta-barrel porin-2 [Hymenobacter chitinivorans DSM 11115]